MADIRLTARAARAARGPMGQTAAGTAAKPAAENQPAFRGGTLASAAGGSASGGSMPTSKPGGSTEPGRSPAEPGRSAEAGGSVPEPGGSTAEAGGSASETGRSASEPRLAPLPGDASQAAGLRPGAPSGQVSQAAELWLGPPPGHTASAAEPHASLDPARRLFPTPTSGELLAVGPHVAAAAAHALTWARLATAAQALGVGLALLDRTVAYAKQRSQFGVPIGSFQAVKHQLADAKVALEFARPLLFGAALTMTESDVAAAKVTACEAAYRTARTALQLHGAIGYTAEYDLSLWLTKARALRASWGSPSECRAAVLGVPSDVSGDGRRS
ncbi:acyl-CoA dehydrogenase family protein [Streptomyces sp. NPDC101455]|uniref:acyl-CoA dehydrogenase family protein n=1 Tax=Streptomyces sp. NPDC101455 TaxID=3366142 RepID=UPI0038297F44